VQKERIREVDIFTYNEAEEIVEYPPGKGLRPSQCTPLFFNAFRFCAGLARFACFAVN
jgi:hypothetical protein